MLRKYIAVKLHSFVGVPHDSQYLKNYGYPWGLLDIQIVLHVSITAICCFIKALQFWDEINKSQFDALSFTRLSHRFSVTKNNTSLPYTEIDADSA